MKAKIIAFINEYRHSILLLYGFIYIPWFSYLESTVTSHFHIIHMVIDDYIPFIEFFIVPYLLWFIYIAVGVLYFFFHNKNEYYRLCIFLITGMTVFLIVSTVYPNGTNLRPMIFERSNIFVDAVKALYSTDTPTNIFPSIHVYNSLAIHIAVSRNEQLKKKWYIIHSSRVMMISIILATVFLKQHSMFDVITAFALAGFMYLLLYTPEWLKEFKQQFTTSKEIKM